METVLGMCVFSSGKGVSMSSIVPIRVMCSYCFTWTLNRGKVGVWMLMGQNGKLDVIIRLQLSIVPAPSKGSSAARGLCLPACPCSGMHCPEVCQGVEKALPTISAGSGSWMSGRMHVHGLSRASSASASLHSDRAPQRLLKTTTVSIILWWTSLGCFQLRAYVPRWTS